MLHVVADVTLRTLFHNPVPATLDFTQFVWMPILVSLGMGLALQRGEHIRVTLLSAPTSSRTQRILEVVGMAFTIAVIAPLAYFTGVRAEAGASIGEAAVGTPWLLIWPSRWIVTIGLIGLTLQAFAQIIRAVTVEEFSREDDEIAAAIEQEESIVKTLLEEASPPGGPVQKVGQP